MRRVLLWGLTGAASVVATLGLSSVAHAAEPSSGAQLPVPQAPGPQVPPKQPTQPGKPGNGQGSNHPGKPDNGKGSNHTGKPGNVRGRTTPTTAREPRSLSGLLRLGDHSVGQQ